jgi:hypothetical protein
LIGLRLASPTRTCRRRQRFVAAAEDEAAAAGQASAFLLPFRHRRSVVDTTVTASDDGACRSAVVPTASFDLRSTPGSGRSGVLGRRWGPCLIAAHGTSKPRSNASSSANSLASHPAARSDSSRVFAFVCLVVIRFASHARAFFCLGAPIDSISIDRPMNGWATYLCAWVRGYRRPCGRPSCGTPRFARQAKPHQPPAPCRQASWHRALTPTHTQSPPPHCPPPTTYLGGRRGPEVCCARRRRLAAGRITSPQIKARRLSQLCGP